MKKSSKLTAFGEYLASHGCDNRSAAEALGVTSSYISMLSRVSRHGGYTKPGLKLALKIQEWTGKTYGTAFEVGKWA